MNRNSTAERFFISLLCAVALFSATTARGEEKRRHQAGLSVEESIEKDNKKEKESHIDQNIDNAGNTITITTDTKTAICTLVIEVENRAEQSDEYEMVAAFIVKRAGTEKPVVSQALKKNITVKGNGTFSETIKKQFVFTEKLVDYSGWDSEKTRDGMTYDGYVVFVKAGGEIVAQESSSSRFLTDDWIAQCEAAVSNPGNKKK